MSTGGVSKARLGRLFDVMAAHVAREEVPGLVTLVGRPGDVDVAVWTSVNQAIDD